VTEKQRDRADNKNPKQSWVAQVVLNSFQINNLRVQNICT
jgi:hypothetical protein